MQHLSRRSPEDEEPAVVAALEGPLGDQLRGEVVVELARLHTSDGKATVAPMDREVLDRARRRLVEARAGHPSPAELETALARAREGLESLALASAELEASVPNRLGSAIQEGMRAEVVPVAKNIAELRGLSNQVVRRLERLQTDLDAERRARVEDLALLVDLVSSGWRGVDRRLDRLERVFDRLERSLDDRPVASLYRIEDRQSPRA